MSVTLDLVVEQLAELRRAIGDLSFKLQPAADNDLLTCGEVDRLYRLRKGTAHETARAQLVRASLRRQRGRDCYLIPRAEAERMWGAK